jgi:hypothetical protein
VVASECGKKRESLTKKRGIVLYVNEGWKGDIKRGGDEGMSAEV